MSVFIIIIITDFVAYYCLCMLFRSLIIIFINYNVYLLWISVYTCVYDIHSARDRAYIIMYYNYYNYIRTFSRSPATPSLDL